MKNIIYILFLSLLIVSCDSDDDHLKGNPDDEALGALSKISNINAHPVRGGVVLKWDLPSDKSFTYVEVSYQKNGKELIKQVSKYSDSLLVEGLINKEPITFDVRTVKENLEEKEVSNLVTTEAVASLKRKPEITYYPDELEKVEVTADMLDTHTQEQSEGPKENLVDGDINTYWHSAWSDGVEPLPHWVQVNFDTIQELGAFKYYHRQGGAEANRPTKWEVQLSDDGENWENVWDSNSVSTAESTEHSLDMEKNYEAKHFRFMIVGTPDMGSLTYLGEISFYAMDARIIDKEQEAEEEYYNF